MKTDNELIAEFMGARRERISEHCEKLCFDNGMPFITKHSIEWSINELLYDTSWDWLMPVCIRLKFDYVCTDISEAYKKVIDEIKKRSLEEHS